MQQASSAKEKKGAKKDKKKQNAQAVGAIKKKVPISDMEERKWRKMLNKRGINTLMMELPKSKGDKDENIKPW